MIRITALIISFFLFSSFSLKDHETYLSVTEIEYKSEKNSLQVISRVFIDDMENVLSKRYGKEVSLSYKQDLKTHKNLLQKYFSKKLVVIVEGKPVELKLLGSKFDADQIVLFLEGVDINSFKKVEIENLLLTDLFDNQKNIVHVKKGDNIESMLLMKDKSSNTVYF
ncbi:DUF6702 family protein [Christiangramia aquimixticola]|uniref:DUF6702 family protein n=1 Tax=Christiangramia aquimixticola TaxID=1697558 RepID=UPI003AA9CF61